MTQYVKTIFAEGEYDEAATCKDDLQVRPEGIRKVFRNLCHYRLEVWNPGTGDMIKLCREAGLPEPEFTLTDGFVTTIRRKPELAFKAVGGVLQPEARSDYHSPDFITGTKSGLSRDQVIVLSKCLDESDIGLLMTSVGRSNRTKFRDQVLVLLLKEGLLTMTVPDKPRSSKQKYRLTEKGKNLLDALIPKGSKS